MSENKLARREAELSVYGRSSKEKEIHDEVFNESHNRIFSVAKFTAKYAQKNAKLCSAIHDTVCDESNT